MKSQLLKSLSIVVLSVTLGAAAQAQRPGGGYPPGTKGNPGGGGSRGGDNRPPQRGNDNRGNDNRGGRGGDNRGGADNRPNSQPQRGYDPRGNGGYHPVPPPVVRGGGYNPYPQGSKGNPGYRPIIVRRYDNHVGYAGNRVIFRDRFDNGNRVRTIYGYNNRQRDAYYRPMNLFGINFYVYNSRFDNRYYSRFPRAWPSPYYNAWFSRGDAWYYRYQNYYSYRQYYTSPSQWLLDYYYSNLLRGYQEEMAQEQGYSSYNTQLVSGQVSLGYRSQLESQIQTNMYAGQFQSVTDSALRDPSHLYVVSEELPVTSAYCEITRGDLLQVVYDGYQNSQYVTLQVVSSKDEACDVGTRVTLSIDQLQEFENSMAADIDDGLDIMANDQQLRSSLSY